MKKFFAAIAAAAAFLFVAMPVQGTDSAAMFKYVPADAQMVFFVDGSAILKNKIIDSFLKECCDTDLEQVLTASGRDAKNFDGVCVIGVTPTLSKAGEVESMNIGAVCDGSNVAMAFEDLKKAIKENNRQTGVYAETDFNGRPAIKFTDKDDSGKNVELFAVLATDRQMQIKVAYNCALVPGFIAATGNASGITRFASNSLMFCAYANVKAFVAANDPNKPGKMKSPEEAMLAMVDDVVFTINTPSSDLVVAELAITCETEQTAASFKQMLEPIIISALNAQDGGPIMEDLTIVQSGKTLKTTIRINEAKMKEIIKFNEELDAKIKAEEEAAKAAGKTADAEEDVEEDAEAEAE